MLVILAHDIAIALLHSIVLEPAADAARVGREKAKAKVHCSFLCNLRSQLWLLSNCGNSGAGLMAKAAGTLGI